MQYSFKEWKRELMGPDVRALAILSFPAAQLLDVPVGDLVTDSGLQAEAMALIGERLPGQAAFLSPMDLSLEAEAFGARVRFERDEVPTVLGRLIRSQEEAESLPIPPVRAGRCQIAVDAVKKLVQRGVDRPVFAGVTGPFSLAGRLMDVSEILIQCMMEPELVRLLLRKATDFLKRYIEAFRQAGANGVILAEPLAGLLSPAWLKEFSSVYIREICEELQEDTFSILYHNCGPNTALALEGIFDTGCAAYHFGNAAPLEEILSKAEADIPILGNLDPVAYFKAGTKKEMDEAVRQLLRAYPEDMQVFYIRKPSLFGEPGDKYTWCNVAGADPSVGRVGSVGVDEAHAISWETFNQISEDAPDGADPLMYSLAPKADGRYRLAWFSGGMWTKLWDYRGMANALTDLYMNPEQVHKVNRKVTEFFKAAIRRGITEAGIDGVGFGDDWGMQKGAFISPDMFREFYFPYYKELCDLAHGFGLHVFLHSCGDAKALIPQIIEAGVDVLHPIQKYAMDEQEIVAEFGDRLSFWAGMDLQRILPFGTVEEVKAEARHFIDTFYQPGKGKMIFTLNNRLEDNVPLENFVAFIEEAYRYGAQAGARDKETAGGMR